MLRRIQVLVLRKDMVVRRAKVKVATEERTCFINRPVQYTERKSGGGCGEI